MAIMVFMNFKRIILFSILTFAVPVVCAASFDIEKWPYYKDIDFAGSDLVRAELDREIFAHSQPDRDDLRVVDQNGEEVPYKLISGPVKEIKADSYSPQLLNNNFVSGEQSSVVLDMGGDGKIVDRIRILTDSENFQRNVKILGSDDRTDWKTLKDDAYIYDYTDERGGVRSRDTEVDIPESVYRYFKVEIDDPAGEPVKIQDVRTFNIPEIREKTSTLDPDFQVKENPKEKTSEVIVDMGVSGIPVKKISLQSPDKNFHRGVYIHTGDNKDKWHYQTGGYIFRYDTDKFKGEDLSLNFSETQDRYIKIVVSNQDNKPITISDVQASFAVREVAFRAPKGKEYKLYYGNPEAEEPQYELDKIFPYLDKNDYIQASFSSQKQNSSYIPPKEPQPPLTERVPYLLPGALLLACAVLLFLVFRFLKK